MAEVIIMLKNLSIFFTNTVNERFSRLFCRYWKCQYIFKTIFSTFTHKFAIALFTELCKMCMLQLALRTSSFSVWVLVCKECFILKLHIALSALKQETLSLSSFNMSLVFLKHLNIISALSSVFWKKNNNLIHCTIFHIEVLNTYGEHYTVFVIRSIWRQ